MNFYDKVCEQNALEWYNSMPPHLRNQVDSKVAGFKSGKDCTRKELPALYATVEKELGPRPLRPADPVDELEGWNTQQMEQYQAHKKWVSRYDELLLISICVEMAPTIQQERRMLNEAMGLNVDAGDLPSQAEGLEDTQAATVRWLQHSGEMPLEFLARTYRNEDGKMGDRITAARTLMDSVHRKVPVKQEIDTKNLTAPKVDPKMLRGLTEKEFET